MIMGVVTGSRRKSWAAPLSTRPPLPGVGTREGPTYPGRHEVVAFGFPPETEVLSWKSATPTGVG